ncbi:MAG: hypothetical protein KGL39_13315 [Patescibacteria group bacterium]|nr:hypothetical protein [Patescibacteria group bacterium]
MKTKLKIILAAAAAIGLCLGALPARADTGFKSFGITNAVLTGPTTNANLGQGLLDLKNYSSCTIVASGTWITTNPASTFIIDLNRNTAAQGIESNVTYSYTFTPPSTGAGAGTLVTNYFTLVTNIDSTVIGSCSGLWIQDVRMPNPNGGGGQWSAPVIGADVKIVPTRFP